ncbi:linear amide C-N hydrolase [Prolixibacteraceae bacterium JC049]|nr:linear amide C-N hydrolase [Prolixibacteraceae bacterium JC049]
MKITHLYLIVILSFSFLLAFSSKSTGCTAFMIKTKDGVVTGRTMDYSRPSVYTTKVYKPGKVIQSVYEPQSPLAPFAWKVAHEFITVNNVLSEPQGYLVAFEGMNKAGIAISGNLAGAEYPHDNPDKPTLSADDIVRYILSLASNLDEVKDLFTSINIVSKWKYHYIIYDKTGNSLVVEFNGGKALFYKNKTPIMTNNPNIPYQLANLNNYANLKNYNPQSITPESGNQFHGAGMFGLPGNWMSPGRFVRGYFMIKEGEKYVSNIKEAINLASKIIESVSLIKGIDLGKSATSNPIYTQIQIVKDLKNNKIYLKRYNEFQWTEVAY